MAKKIITVMGEIRIPTKKVARAMSNRPIFVDDVEYPVDCKSGKTDVIAGPGMLVRTSNRAKMTIILEDEIVQGGIQ